MKKFLSLMLALLLAGCALGPGPASKSEDQMMDAASELLTGIGAADSLLLQGEKARMSGDYASATHHFERGLRLAPRSAALYLALAKTRLAMADYPRAQQMAQKSISLLPTQASGQEKKAKAEAWIVIAQSKSKLGDSLGADRARANAQAAW